MNEDAKILVFTHLHNMVVAEDNDYQRNDVHTDKHGDKVEAVREVLYHVAVRAAEFS